MTHLPPGSSGFARLRTFGHWAYPADRIAAERDLSVSICLPARNEVATIGPIVDALTPLVACGAVDEVVVLDDSTDGTGELAAAHGATVHCQSDLCGDVGPLCGKGDAMWRALSVLASDIICFLDADSECFGAHFACGLVGAVTCERDVAFAKAFYRRPFRAGAVVMPHGGGRVTELAARPLLEFFFPELTDFRQPLAGEMAAKRDVLEALPFVTGYGVDVALLIDAYRAVGLGALAQVDLEVRQNQHKPLADLRPMAGEVLRAVLSRVQREGRLGVPDIAALTIDLLERPPVRVLRPVA